MTRPKASLTATFGLILASVIVAVLFAVSLPGPSVLAHENRRPEHWVGTWSAAQAAGDLGMFATVRFANEGFKNQTVRMVVRASIGGPQVRVRLSNAYGASPLLIGAAHIALCKDGSAIVPATDRVLTFSGDRSIRIPPDGTVLSDPVDMSVPELAELSVSVYVPGNTGPTSWHPWGHHLSYVSGAGDFTAATDFSTASTPLSWFWLSAVEVAASQETGAIVVLGDSMTEGDEGSGITPRPYRGWLDVLAQRLIKENGHHPKMAVLNAGISGNRLLNNFVAASGLARLERDAFAQEGVKSVIVQEGINDIGLPTVSMFADHAQEVITADEFIAGLRQVAERAHARGIRAFVCTLIPMQGAAYDLSENEAKREVINHWIRTSGVFDAVFDFDAVVRDPDHPKRISPAMDPGDHLHPNEAGYKAMGDSIDLSLFWDSGKANNN